MPVKSFGRKLLLAVVLDSFLLVPAAAVAQDEQMPNVPESEAPQEAEVRRLDAGTLSDVLGTNPPAPAEAPPVKAAADAQPSAAAEEYRENPMEALVKVNLQDLLDTNVTAASKEQEGASVAPSSVTVYTREDIARLGVRTVERLLNFVPGFQGTTDSGNGMFRISARGRNTTGHEYVLVLVDGQRLADIHHGGAINPIAIENIQQIEIIRGPGSALYGANAFLGVINIKTNREYSNVVAAAGDLNNRYLAANLAKDLGELRIAAFAKFYSDDGFRHPDITDIMGHVGDARDPVREVDGYLTLDYKGLTLHAWHLERSFSGISCCTPYSQYSDQSAQVHSSARLTYRLEVNDRVDIDFAAALARDRSFDLAAKLPVGAVPDLRSGVTLAETYVFGTEWTGNTVDGNVDLRWRFLSTHWLKGTAMAGGSYEYTKVTDAADVSSHDPAWQYVGDLHRWPKPGIDRTTAAGYLQARLDLLSKVQLTAGARYDWYSDFGASFNPRAALVFRTPISSHVKLMVGRAFRAPSFGELYDQPLRTSTVVYNDLKPETLTTYELGYAQRIANYAHGTLTFFHTNLRDIIQPPENRLRYRNLGSSIMNGLELELRTREVFGFNLLATYTHLFPRAEEKEQLIVPFDFGAVALSYSWDRLMVNVNAVMRGASRVGGHAATDVTGTSFLRYDQPASTLLGSHLQVEVLRPIKLFVLAENLFDHRFQRVNDLAAPPGLLSRGRTFLGGLRADY